MRPFERPVVAIALAGLLASCATAPRPNPGSTGTSTPTATAPTPPPPKHEPDPKVARVRVFALSDFHGWLLPLEPKGFNKYYGGIANLAGMLTHKERFMVEDSVLLDNGDMFTGPTESTFLRGEPVIQAYNALGFTAANIANHEFDYGLEILRARIGEAQFPFLGANIRNAGAETSPSFVKPFTIVERDGVKVGVIGLSYEKTQQTTLAVHVQGLEFQPYGPTLQAVVPEARKAGAEVIVVLFHDTVARAAEVLEGLPDLGIDAVVAGQNHRKGRKVVHGAPIVNPGPFGRSYVKFTIEVDRASRKVLSNKDEIVDVAGDVGAAAFPPDPKLLAIAEGARQRARALSGEVIGSLSRPLPIGTFGNSPLGHLITDTWLAAFPEADLAICNHGALRQPLPGGDVSVSDLMSVLPFENNLYLVEVTGAQLMQQLTIDGPIVSGGRWTYQTKDGKRTVTGITGKDGKAFKSKAKYTVIINDFMYFGGDGFGFKDLDATPEDTGLSFREPLIRALRNASREGRALAPETGARATPDP